MKKLFTFILLLFIICVSLTACTKSSEKIIDGDWTANVDGRIYKLKIDTKNKILFNITKDVKFNYDIKETNERNLSLFFFNDTIKNEIMTIEIKNDNSIKMTLQDKTSIIFNRD